MKQVLALLTLCVAISCAVPSPGQSRPVAITPAKVTMLVGEAHEFKAVDPGGHSLTNISWTVSDPAVAELTAGDQAVLTATHPGKLTLTAHAYEGDAEAEVEVLEGTTMPNGGLAQLSS